MSNLRLSIVMAIMASLSTTMLGLGQGSALLPGMTMLAAVTSVLFTDLLGWFRLNRIVANLAMLLAAFFSLYGFLEAGSQQQLWAIANLLIYVQMVLLFQEKNRRVYGQLAMFSLLQVVVAALLNSGLEFGILLGLYMVIALLGFVLFFVYREVGRVGMVPRRRSWFALAEPVVESPDGPLDAQLDGPPIIHVTDQARALNQKIVTRRLAPPLVAMVAATVVFTAVFFYATPRTGWNWERSLGRRSIVGFSPEVSFQEMGRLLQSDERVMRVSFSNARTDEVYTVIGEPYLRGVVLTKYIDGRWQQEVPSSRLPLETLEPPPPTRDLVRQEVLLEPTGDSRLFSMFPVYALTQSGNELRIDPRTRHLLRVGTPETRSEYRYVVATTAFSFGAQLQVIPHPNRLGTEAERTSMVRLNRWMRNINSPESLPQLIALAEEIVRDKAPDGDALQRARALESHFLENGRYTYTLDLDQIRARRQEGVDPIEDFVSNHHAGHCEYFASALTLMLRSQDIPARMVVGFRPRELNFIGNYYSVRQRDAHAWVEAYVEPDAIPRGALNPEERHAGGGWLRLDPTPGDELQTLQDKANVLDRASNSLDYARWLWSDYVLRLTEERQRQAILGPLALDRRVTISSLLDTEAWRQYAQEATGSDLPGLLRGEFSWRGGLAAVFICVAAVFGYRLVRSAWPLLRQGVSLRRAISRRRKPVTVAFYRRFESAMGGIGLRRSVSQTQRQFAAEVARHLAASPRLAAAADIPHQIVDAFYRVRFGRWIPTPRQEAEIQDKLKRLEEALAN